MTFVQAIKPGGVSVGDIVRTDAQTTRVPYEWTNVLATVIGVDGMETPGDCVTLEAPCGARLGCETESIHKLDAVEQLAWIAWKGEVVGIRETAEQFQKDRDRENEWITSGEIVLVSDDDYADDVRSAFKDARSGGRPFDTEDVERLQLDEWKYRACWVRARVVEPPRVAKGAFKLEVIEDLAAESAGYGLEPGETVEARWNRVWRIEPTPEDG